MRNSFCSTLLPLPVLLLASGIAWAQAQPQTWSLVINGQAGQAQVVEINGRAYVDLAMLAQIANGSMQFKEKGIILTLPSPHQDSAPIAAPPNSSDDSALSRDFMRAGIEGFATMREWASTMAYTIQNGYHVTDSWAADHREEAANKLKLASAAAVTGGDRNALQLLTHEFDAVRQWSDKLVQERKSMDTAKYTVSPNALRDEPLSQKITNCGRFLASMLGSGAFQDDPSCH